MQEKRAEEERRGQESFWRSKEAVDSCEEAEGCKDSGAVGGREEDQGFCSQEDSEGQETEDGRQEDVGGGKESLSRQSALLAASSAHD